MPCADMKVNSLAHNKTELSSNHDNHSHDKEKDL